MNAQGRQQSDWWEVPLDAAGARRPAETEGAEKARGATNGGAKEVSWADNKSLPPEQYTFYREGTPPPSLPDDSGFDFHLSDEPGNRRDEYDYTYDRVAPPAPIPPATVCGIPRRRFWILAAVVALLVVIGVGVGAGVGLGAGSKKDATDSQPSPSATISIPTSTTVAQTSTSKTATPTAIDACPAANNTKFLVPGTEKTFLRICGIDYSGAGQATDLGVVWTGSMQDCMVSCAGYPGCTGCGWGVIQGDTGSDHRCWLKGDLQQSHVVRTGWDFAILQ